MPRGRPKKNPAGGRPAVVARNHGLKRERNSNPAELQIRQGRPKTYNHIAGNLYYRPEYFTVGAMELECPHDHCMAKHFDGEKIGSRNTFHFTNCCHDGQVKLPEECLLTEPPLFLQELFTAQSKESKGFRENIRAYNAAFQFASFTADMVKFKGGGPPVFKMHGQAYHRIGHFEATKDHKYGQVYILDSKEALDARMTNNSQCDVTIMASIQDFILENNTFAHDYKMISVVLEEEIERVEREGGPRREVKMVFRSTFSDDRRKNLPVTDEVAAVFADHNGDPPGMLFSIAPTDGNGSGLKNLPQTSSFIDPMVYPLFFISGERGWSIGIPKTKRRRKDDGDEGDEEHSSKTVTQLMFYSWRLSIREGFSALHHGGKLFQQFVVDAYVRIEGLRLLYMRLNQTKLRADTYKGLVDHIPSDGGSVGRRVILPSSFIGGPRAMAQNFQDAMSIVAEKGTPSLFITVTCNPQDPDIVDNLLPGQTASDRPDIVARVFHLKVKEIEKDVKDRKIFGEVIAMIYVVEYQKRGLPHIHMLVILNPVDKALLMENIDNYVCAELPDKNGDPELYQLVTKSMIHTPCSAINSPMPCKINGLCSKDFPKQLSEHTILNHGGFPRYRRRAVDPVVTRIRNQEYSIDNTWVVPYNPYMLRKYKCHINVEVCATVKSVKYLYKYVYKGHDQANLEIREIGKDAEGNIEHDEILRYVNARYVSPAEAVWRIFSYKLDYTTHTIYRLPLHLEGEQKLFFMDGRESEALGNAEIMISQLQAFFILNQTIPSANKFLYREIPLHFVYNKKNRKWNERKKGGEKVIGRMYSIDPKDRELYFLRLLLLHVRGPKGFEDLRTVGGIVYPTFQRAAQALNLFESDDQWKKTMDEARVFQTGPQLRQLFVSLCVFCDVKDPKHLFETFYIDMVDDIENRNPKRNKEEIEQLCLRDIDDRFRLLGKGNETFYLPKPEKNPWTAAPYDQLEQQQKAHDSFEKLNNDQRNIFQDIMEGIYDHSSSKSFFISGPAGTGKTFLYHALCQELRGRGEEVICVAYSGVAASLLDGGRTVNSRFGIPIHLYPNTTSMLKTSGPQAEAIRRAKLIIWDEAPMVHKNMMECVDRFLKDLADEEKKCLPFGGKAIVLGGDFRQTLPIIKRGKPGDDINASIKNSYLWPSITVKHLNINMRVGEGEIEFAEFLKRVGDGVEPIMSAPSTISLPTEWISSDLIEDVFGGMLANMEELTMRAILCPTNDFCDQLNEEILGKLDGEVRTYLSFDRALNEEGQEEGAYQPEFLHSAPVTGMPPHELNVKIGAVVMLLRNMNPSIGLINGTRMVVRRMSDNILECEILTGVAVGQMALIPKFKLMSSDCDLPFTLQRCQFPVRLSYAMTINKAQGQSLQKVGIHLVKPVFSHGQLYVALSRARNYANVFVQIDEAVRGSSVLETENVVYKDALL